MANPRQARGQGRSFFGKVINNGSGKKGGKKDTTESGCVQIEIFGQNTGLDNHYWAFPLMPMGSGAAMAGVGSSPHGLEEESTVFGFFADNEETIPLILGVLHKAGSDQGNDGETVSSKENSTPKGFRTKEKDGGDINDVIGKESIVDHGQKKQLHKNKKTIGSKKYDGKGVHEVINSVDPQNEAGAIPGALNASKDILNQIVSGGAMMDGFGGLMDGTLSLGGLMSMVQMAQGMIGGMGGGGGGGGGQGSGNMPSSMTPQGMEDIKSSYFVTQDGIEIFIELNGSETTGSYFLDSAIAAISVTITTKTYDPYGNIQEITVVIKEDGKEISETYDTESSLAAAQLLGSTVVTVYETVLAEHISNISSVNAFTRGYSDYSWEDYYKTNPANLSYSQMLAISNANQNNGAGLNGGAGGGGGGGGAGAGISTALGMLGSLGGLGGLGGLGDIGGALGGLGGLGDVGGLLGGLGGLGGLGDIGGALGGLGGLGGLGDIGGMLGGLGGLDGLGGLGSMIGAFGGLDGMMSMAQGDQGVYGPLTKTFTPSTKTNETIKKSAKKAFQSAKDAPKPESENSDLQGMMGQIGNIAGIVSGLVPGASSLAGGNMPMSMNMQNAFNKNITPGSLLNTTIEIPGLDMNNIRDISQKNIGSNININNELSPIPVTPSVDRAASGRIIPNYSYNSSTKDINSLNNSLISVELPTLTSTTLVDRALNRNDGVNFEINGTLYQQLGANT